ncbi:SDR family NAD(P)-dependent oxidoreductase [Streptomyces lonarensis]|uniref:SDR family oxidoreductase n=1 Tax=Streptomyces lonarensis TaxID=700599 RepID=A0A7X6D2Y6_9ACTN|nr:SDR family oxidoreductase [Streptomyces lonarensis]NJQ07189.1 SDR family oxidoreductase [Streptomyces lonarensis]
MRGVLVTGASRGIGRAVATAFAERGDRVAVHFATREQEARATLAALPGTGHVLVAGDLGEPGAALTVVSEADERLGGIDVLVNNAALAPGPGNRHAVAEDGFDAWQRAWRTMTDVNLLGPADLTFHVARRLIERGSGGAVVNIGSRGAFRGEPDHPAYGAAKAALHAFGQSMALALAPHDIAVSSVAPGFVATERQADRIAGAEGDALRAQSPFGRVGTPQEVAAAVLYLASSEARWASGTVLDLNGASHLRT